MASTCPAWTVVGNGGQLWSRISSLSQLDHFMLELRNLGLVYQVIACTAIWDKIGQISFIVAYNGPEFVAVSRYDRLGPYFSLHNLFWTVLTLYVIFGHCKIKVPGMLDSAEKWSIIIRYESLWRDMTNYGHIRHRITNTDQFSTSAPEDATYDLRRQLVAYYA